MRVCFAVCAPLTQIWLGIAAAVFILTDGISAVWSVFLCRIRDSHHLARPSEETIILPVVCKGKSADHVSSKTVFETREKERERDQAFDTVQREAKKLPGIQRKIAVALMGGGEGRATMKEARQRIGISPASFYREKEKVRRKLRKLKPIWVRFGKALGITRRPV